MHPNARKNQKLIRQYPFLSLILAARMEPHGNLKIGEAKMPGWVNAVMTRVDNLVIRVEKADGDLMFRQAHNLGLGDGSLGFSSRDNREGQVVRCGEHLFAVDGDDLVINRLDWPRNMEEQHHLGEEVYGWMVLWTGRTKFADGSTGFTNPAWDRTKYLVWVTVEAWHTDTRNDDQPESRFGDFQERSVTVTIYRAPEQGFESLQREASVYSNLRLNSEVMMRGVLKKDHDIVSIGGMLYEMCITFQDEVYFNGMKEVLDNGSFRGASGQFGSVKVLCAEMCGYDRVTLKDAKSYVTFQLRPGSKHMYVLGQQGTLPQIRNLVRTVVRMWRENPASRAAFKPDERVSVI